MKLSLSCVLRCAPEPSDCSRMVLGNTPALPALEHELSRRRRTDPRVVWPSARRRFLRSRWQVWGEGRRSKSRMEFSRYERAVVRQSQRFSGGHNDSCANVRFGYGHVTPDPLACRRKRLRISTTRSSSGLVELTQLGKYFNTTVGYAAILWFGGIVIVYFMICYPLTRFGWWTDIRMAQAKMTETDYRTSSDHRARSYFRQCPRRLMGGS